MADSPDPPLPLTSELRRAIDIYLSLAYPDGRIPLATQARQAPLATVPEQAPVQPDWFETAAKEGRTIYRLRLGQRDYPHMKLSLEPAPDSSGYLYFADTHDGHLHVRENSPEAPALAALRESNARLVERIETAWEQAGLPTFRAYLRAALSRRRNQGII